MCPGFCPNVFSEILIPRVKNISEVSLVDHRLCAFSLVLDYYNMKIYRQSYNSTYINITENSRLLQGGKAQKSGLMSFIRNNANYSGFILIVIQISVDFQNIEQKTLKYDPNSKFLMSD